ncbi:hypothetical protein HK097_006269, partial [Rhizophlyctis rosea]
MKILEGDLPEHVDRLDRMMARTALAPPPPAPVSMEVVRVPDVQEEPVRDQPTDQLVPETMLSTRRNVFDGDEFDVFARGTVDRSKVVFGKKDENAEEVINDRTFVRENKASLLDTQYDDYDDEYDDTYDSTDIKLAGTVELHMLDEDENLVDGKRVEEPEDPFAQFEPELVGLYESNKGIFDKGARKTPEREKFKKRTGMSDEQLEGWGKMFDRNPRRGKVMEKYEWRGNKAVEEDEAGDSGPQQNGGGNDGQRGGGRGGRGGRGGGIDRGRGRG